MAKKQFKAESKRLLDLMINSIYTHQEIFLREIISNASDAIDKLAYQALTDEKVGLSRSDFAIQLKVDEPSRTLTVSDNGIGMDKDEMENNLGTICKSGSLQFKKDMEKKEDIDIIGQFGVGFYSAFMVADTVTVISKKYGSEEAWKWTSSGADGYTMEPAEREDAAKTFTLNQGWFSKSNIKRCPTIPVAPITPTLNCFIVHTPYSEKVSQCFHKK